jgi:5-methylcytosine-specific restriction enzyme subunit McrC
MTLCAEDCSPLSPPPDAEAAAWLADIARSVLTSKHVLGLGSARDGDEPVVFCDWDGTWRTGRYIGSLTFKGRSLMIRPRLGLDTIRKWLTRANNLLVVTTPGEMREDKSFIAELVSRVWAHGLADAARHGLPALRADVISNANVVRGRFDVAASIATRSLIHRRVISVKRERNLANPVAQTIACAYAVLRRWMGRGTERDWLPARVQELLPQLLAATGARPDLPSEAVLARVRYTPITRRYQRFVRLSWQIAQQRGLFGDAASEGSCTGVLLDVAELWELYVISVAREAVSPWVVKHGTHDELGRDHLLKSEVDGSILAQLRPDALIEVNHRPIAVLDAKYKRLAAWPSPQAEDLYQLAAYLMRFGAKGALQGAMIYPFDHASQTVSDFESKSPWGLSFSSTLSFLTLPHDAEKAVRKIREFFSLETNY